MTLRSPRAWLAVACAAGALTVACGKYGPPVRSSHEAPAAQAETPAAGESDGDENERDDE